MHSLPAIAAVCLTVLALACTQARAEPASGWVDPPAKAEKDASDTAEPKPAAAQAARPAEPPAATREASRSERADTRRSARRSRTRQADERADRRRVAAPSEIDARPLDPRFAGWAGTARRLTGEYLASVSSSNEAMLASAPRFYGERVRFHGRSMSLAALIAEKRRFGRRWPERRYEPQEDTMRTACHAESAACTVHTVMGFRAGNPMRGARSEGLSELTLTVSFAGGRPVIVSESSRVLRRGSAALGSAERGRDGA